MKTTILQANLATFALPTHEEHAVRMIALERVASGDEPLDIARDISDDFDVPVDGLFSALFLGCEA